MKNSPKQTKQTARKAAKANRLRAKNWTWERISLELGIVKESGDPDPGLMYKIAVEGYEPKTQAVRDRLGLRAACMTCMRSIRKKGREIARALAPWESWWRSLSRADREKEIKKAYKKRIQ